MRDRANRRALQEVVRQILWDEWDPINLKAHEGWPEDEYDQYVLPVVGKIINGGSAEEIADYLQWASDENMGCPMPRDETVALAAKLLRLRNTEAAQ